MLKHQETQAFQLPSLQQRILTDGRVLEGGLLRVDSFLNQQVDMLLMKEIGESFLQQFNYVKPTVILTIESSGIAPAGMTALAMGLPLVVCKKQVSRVARDERLATPVRSFTKDSIYELSVNRAFVPQGARALFIDDFLAMGEAALGAARLVEQAGAQLVGIGIVIEKSFQPGRVKLEQLGVPIVSLARIAKMRAMRQDELDAADAIKFVIE
ncbi:xanthine phosphoribosyltransferase 1 [Clostridia bacterium]|nr:xanthine phosphoribosyltransferase 1 [Clostridia bacterium]